MISIIVAIAQNNIIGGDNSLLWHISEDLRNFKRITSGHPVIMGRKTFESLGRPLPNRTNVVITRQDLKIEGCEVVHSLEEAIALFSKDEEIFIIGGAQIYAQALNIADKLYITRVEHTYEGDTLFPKWDNEQWHITSKESFERGEKYPHPFSFEEYTRAPQYTIRDTTAADIPLIRELAAESFEPTYRNICSAEQIEFMFDWMYSVESLEKQFAEGHRFYILYDNQGLAVGYGSIEQQEPKLFHLQRLYLNPSTQGKGHGKRLFWHLASEVKRIGGAGCRMELNVNRENIATKFYFAQGMKIALTENFPIEGTPYYKNDYILYLDIE